MPNSAEKALTVVVLIALPTVMYGGYSLLRLLGTGQLTEFQNTYFRAGHAHAGVLLVLTLVALNIAGRFRLSPTLTWTLGILLLVGTLAQSGGMFVHMLFGRPEEWSLGNSVTVGGALLLVAGLVALLYGVIANRPSAAS